MASVLPPVRGVPFSFPISLVSQSDTDTFQNNPTLANGDVKVIKDCELDGNIDTLPTAITSLPSVLVVALSADEMTADVVSVLFHDAAGNEWQDGLVTIYTAAQTFDTTDGVSDTISGIVGHTDYGNAKLVRSATPANLLGIGVDGSINSVLGTVDANVVEINGDTDPVANLVLALGSGGLVDKLNSMLEAAGLAYRFTVAALAEAPSEAGSGTGTYTDTIKDPSNNPLDGARVQLSTDAAGAHRVYEAFTNALGVFVMNPDPGTYYRWIDLAGYADRLTQGAQVTVT